MNIASDSKTVWLGLVPHIMLWRLAIADKRTLTYLVLRSKHTTLFGP
jgi:hypothetical protein